MVAMGHGETTGGVVYLYDPISDRGDPRFAFKTPLTEAERGKIFNANARALYKL